MAASCKPSREVALSPEARAHSPSRRSKAPQNAEGEGFGKGIRKSSAFQKKKKSAAATKDITPEQDAVDRWTEFLVDCVDDNELYKKYFDKVIGAIRLISYYFEARWWDGTEATVRKWIGDSVWKVIGEGATSPNKNDPETILPTAIEGSGFGRDVEGVYLYLPADKEKKFQWIEAVHPYPFGADYANQLVGSWSLEIDEGKSVLNAKRSVGKLNIIIKSDYRVDKTDKEQDNLDSYRDIRAKFAYVDERRMVIQPVDEKTGEVVPVAYCVLQKVSKRKFALEMEELNLNIPLRQF